MKLALAINCRKFVSNPYVTLLINAYRVTFICSAANYSLVYKKKLPKLSPSDASFETKAIVSRSVKDKNKNLVLVLSCRVLSLV